MNKTPTIFPFDDDFRGDDVVNDDDSCPCCNKLFSNHSKGQLVKCALTELGGD